MRTLTLLLVLLAVAAAPAQRPKVAALAVTGDTITVVRSLPCTVTAPPGGSKYWWTYPAGVTATASRNVLTITAAPNGVHAVRAEWLTVDFDAKTVTDGDAAVDVTIIVPDPATAKGRP